VPALIEPIHTPSPATATVPLIQVVDDDVSIQSLFRTICAQAGYEVRIYGSVTAFQARSADDRPGCLVLDLMLPDGTGIDVLQQLSQQGDHIPVVFMSGMASVAEAVCALKLGSLDFVQKPFDLACMREALDRAIAIDLHRRHRAKEQAWLRKRFQNLSPRETEVMERIVRGAANKEVALQLGLSPKTVEVHRANVMRKTGANSLAELVRMHVTVHGRVDRNDP
jgi:two-component system, LuxR family, response regulator FixJ